MMNDNSLLSDFVIKTLDHLKKDDATQIHRIHLDSLSNDVMPNLGLAVEARYLAKLMKADNGAVIVASSKDEIVGFLLLRFAELNMKEFLSVWSILRFVILSLVKPIIMIRLIYQLVKSSANPKGSCEVDYFAVSDSMRGIGIGGKLLEEAEKVAFKKNYSSIVTKTNNVRLCSYYRNVKEAKLISSFRILKDEYFNVCWSIR